MIATVFAAGTTAARSGVDFRRCFLLALKARLPSPHALLADMRPAAPLASGQTQSGSGLLRRIQLERGRHGAKMQHKEISIACF